MNRQPPSGYRGMFCCLALSLSPVGLIDFPEFSSPSPASQLWVELCFVRWFRQPHFKLWDAMDFLQFPSLRHSHDFGATISRDFGATISHDFGVTISHDFGTTISRDFGATICRNFGNYGLCI